jgi:choline dehydrogenase-like flavoprotein
MFVDARTLPRGAVLDADLCLVGAGPAAIPIALQLSGLGLRIVLVESGAIRPQIRRKYLDIGSSVGYQYYNLMFTRARAFGGSSSRWHMHAHGDEGWMARPFDPIDFEQRDGIPWTGWPFDFAHLEPYYRRAHELSDLGPATFETADWERPGMARLPLDEACVTTSVLQRGMTTFQRFRDEFAAASTITVFHHATVTEIVSSGEPATVERLEVATAADRRFTIRARWFVLAAGGIENPRLLLSSVGHQPAGLGNGHDLVGRFFMEHLAGRVGYVRPPDPGTVADAGLYDSHEEGNVFVQAALTPNPDVLRREGLPNMAFFLLPRPDDFTTEGVRSLKALVNSVYRRPWVGHTGAHVRNVVQGAAPTARILGRRVVRSEPRDTVLVVRTQAEQVPHPESRVTIGRGRDRYGTPRVVIDWRVTDFDTASIRRGEEIVDAELRRAGIGRIERMLGEEDPPVVFEGDHHHIGTTRMDADPARGVVDVDGRVHGVRNLWVAGSSVFPTGGWINPTLTIVALSVRLADHLQREIEAA